MVPLPKGEWQATRLDADRVAVAMHLNGPRQDTLFWTKFNLSDLPNDVVTADDVARLGIGAAN